MFKFQKLCHEIEHLSATERAALLAEKSILVIKGLRELDLPGIDAVTVLASFIIGSAVSDGTISEKNYLFIYPALSKAFGDACDLAEIKRSFKVSKDAKKEIETYTRDLVSILSKADEQLAADVIALCLLVTSVDGKISLKEKHYILKLCMS